MVIEVELTKRAISHAYINFMLWLILLYFMSEALLNIKIK